MGKYANMSCSVTTAATAPATEPRVDTAARAPRSFCPQPASIAAAAPAAVSTCRLSYAAQPTGSLRKLRFCMPGRNTSPRLEAAPVFPASGSLGGHAVTNVADDDAEGEGRRGIRDVREGAGTAIRVDIGQFHIELAFAP